MKKVKIIVFLLMIVLYQRVFSFPNKTNFFTIFEKKGEIKLQTSDLGIGVLGKLKINKKNNQILFLDPMNSKFVIFKENGEYLNKVGRKGQGPGEFFYPSCIETDERGNIYVADYLRRVNKFDENGKFLNSFIISGKHWQPFIMKINSKGHIYLGGLKENFKNPGTGEWINLYNEKGKYIKSFFKTNKFTKEWMLSIYPQCMFDIDSQDNIYAIQHNEYKIYKYNSMGKLLKTIGNPPKYFKPPNFKGKIDFSKYRKDQRKLREKLIELSKSWTKLINIKIIKNYLIIVLETNNLIKYFTKRYIIDILDKEGNIIAGGIQTDYKLLCKDKDDNLYFLIYTDEEEALEKEPTYIIGKYSLKLN